MNKFETNWMTFTLAAILVVGGFVLLAMGKINSDTFEWLVTTGAAAYTARTIVNKITGGK